MDSRMKEAVMRAVDREPFARALGLKLVDLSEGFSVVEMTYEPASMNNLCDLAHGGAVFTLIDEAFQTACQSYGTLALALNVNVTYLASPEAGARLRAVAKAASRTKRTASFDIKVTDQKGRLLATCQALSYDTGKPLPYL